MIPPPPPLPAAPLSRYRRVVTIGALLAGVGAVIYLTICGTDTPWVPKCLFHSLTGLDCPGCGSQRAIAAATHGRWADAWNFNPALWVGLCVAVLYICFPGRRVHRSRIERVLYSPAAYALIAMAIVAWAVWRNV